ncbi:MAG: MG2 domain-containing protein, partial [Brevinematales bacterium]
MDKKIKTITIESAVLIFAALTIIFFIIDGQIENAAMAYIFAVCAGSVSGSLFSMILNRLITRKWGNLFKGMLLFIVLSAFVSIFAFTRNPLLIGIILLITGGTGVYLFIRTGRIWDFSSKVFIFKFAAGLFSIPTGGIKRFPLPVLLSAGIILLLGNACFFYLKERNLPESLLVLLLIAAGGAALTLCAMILNRLITTRWGNFVKGWPVFQAAAGLLFYPFIQSPASGIISSIILFGFALLAFIHYGFSWVYASKDNLPPEPDKPGKSSLILKQILSSISMHAAKIPGSIKNILKSKYLATAAAAVFAVVLIIVLIRVFLSVFAVTVKDYSPSDSQPAPFGLRTSVRLNLSESVSITNSAVETLIETNLTGYSNVSQVAGVFFIKPSSGILSIKPEIKGTWRFEDGTSFIFTPEEELNPSTEYHVVFSPGGLLYKKGRIILGKDFAFSTFKFEVTDMRVFFNYDVADNEEKEIVGEINFNTPVDIDMLKNNISMIIDNKDVNFTIEASGIPTRFYIKSDQFKKKDSLQNIVLKVRHETQCARGGKTLTRDYSEALVLPEKENLKVMDAKSWPVSGNTYMVMLFNRPVSADQIRQKVLIKSANGSPAPFTVETEYCYAVLKADFKPGTEYEITAMKGMTSDGGLFLPEDFRYSLVIQDLKPDVGFSSGGNVLPSEGSMNIELSTVNLDSFRVKVDKIYRNNLVYFLKNPGDNEYVKPILYKTYDVEGGNLNENVLHYINLYKFHNMAFKGLYRITLSDPKAGDEDTTDYNPGSKSKVVLCTDLGIFAKHSGKDLIVNIYSIMGLEPVADADVTLVSSDNQAISSVKTGADGQAVFENWMQGGEEKFRPSIIIAEKNGDFSYLEFDNSLKDQSRFSVGGRTPPAGNELQAFITPERGLYRPGDKAYISAIVRNGDLSLPAGLEVSLEVKDPQDRRLGLYNKKVPVNGILSFEVPFPAYARTGNYQASLKIGEDIIIGSTELKVEEFIPDKIEVNIKAGDSHTNYFEPLSFSVKGLQLFGPPAAGNRVKTQVRFVPREFSAPQFKDYSFSDPERKYDGETFDLGEDKLDARGEKEYELKIPESVMPSSALYAQIYSEVYDEGGRPVNTMKTVSVDRYPVYFGIKIAGRDSYNINEPVSISLAAVDAMGAGRNVSNISIVIKHIVYYSIFRQYGGKTDYGSQPYEELFAHETIGINKIRDYKFIPKTPGNYVVYLGNDDTMRSSAQVYVEGPGIETSDMTQPENLTITMNKDRYNIGDNAAATVRSSIPGKLFFSIEREKVLYSCVTDLTDNKATVHFTIPAGYVPNAYVVAYVIRKPDPGLIKLPMSALGIKTLNIEPGNKKMAVNIISSDTARSGNGVDVKVRVGDSTGNCGVVIAAVDEGILQITEFKTPDPFAYFYDKKALGTSLYSIFDSVLPDIKAVREAIGGDEANYDMKLRHINPVAAKRVRSVSLYSGILKPGQDGIVNYHFNLPQFNGRLRLMALSADGDRFGSASKYVTVSDPIVLSYSLPRIMAPGDSIELPVQVYNQTGKKALIRVSLNVEGPVTVMGRSFQDVFLEQSGQRVIYFKARAIDDAGKALFRFEAISDDIITSNTAELAVRPARAIETITRYGEIGPGGEVKVDVPAGYYKFGQRVRFTASPIEITKFLGAMEYLIGYPYGCSEQTVSSAFPLIYYKDLADLTGCFKGESINAGYFVQEAVKKLQGMLLPAGEFSIWPGGTVYSHYNSLYVCNFLIEASRHGYDVDQKVLDACDGIIEGSSPAAKKRLDRRTASDSGDADPYRLYLLALTGKPDREAMEYLRLNMLKDMNYADRCRLASGYALSGDTQTAAAVLPSSFAVEYFPRVLGGDYDSPVMRLSIYLEALCRINRTDPRVEGIAAALEKSARNGNFGTTHDNGLALIALAGAFDNT